MRAQVRPLTALVVEDEALVRCDIVSVLRDRDWLVLETAGAEAAIAMLAHQHVDVVFTDIQLGGLLSGWDVAEAARKSQPDVDVIYTSSKTMEPSRRVERSLFFAKPYGADDVVVACQRLVRSQAKRSAR
jgi:CheY-like chemotaxis protein